MQDPRIRPRCDLWCGRARGGGGGRVARRCVGGRVGSGVPAARGSLTPCWASFWQGAPPLRRRSRGRRAWWPSPRADTCCVPVGEGTLLVLACTPRPLRPAGRAVVPAANGMSAQAAPRMAAGPSAVFLGFSERIC